MNDWVSFKKYFPSPYASKPVLLTGIIEGVEKKRRVYEVVHECKSTTQFTYADNGRTWVITASHWMYIEEPVG
jgi:hypothetical protein